MQPYSLFSPRRENRQPYSASSHPHPEGSDPDFVVLGRFRFFCKILASGVGWKAENAFGHNALTRRIDPHAAETPITSKNLFFAFYFLHFSRPFQKPPWPNTNF